MATDYALDLRATLDTSEVQQKLGALRSSGVDATSQLEEAVKRLDNAIQDLTRSWEKQADAAQQAAERAQEAASASADGGPGGGMSLETDALLKSLLSARRLKAVSKIIDVYGYGDTELGTVAKSGLAGAALGMTATKSPTGALIGGIAGVIKGFEDLKSAAKAAAAAVQAKADKERAEYREWLIEQTKEQEKAKDLDSIKSASATTLNEYVSRYAMAKTNYAARLEAGPSVNQTETEFKTEMEGLAEQLESYGVVAKAAEKELGKRAKADEKAAKEAEKKADADRKAAERQEKEAQRQKEREERFNKSIDEQASRWAREEDMRQFKEDLGGMMPKEMLKSRQKYLDEATQLEKERDLYINLAKNSKDPRDLAKAQDKEDAARVARQKASALESSILSFSNIGGNSLKDFLSEPMSSEAAKGYDVGGYASLEDAVWKQQLETQKSIDDHTKTTADKLSTIATKVEMMANTLQNNNIRTESTWG